MSLLRRKPIKIILLSLFAILLWRMWTSNQDILVPQANQGSSENLHQLNLSTIPIPFLRSNMPSFDSSFGTKTEDRHHRHRQLMNISVEGTNCTAMFHGDNAVITSSLNHRLMLQTHRMDNLSSEWNKTSCQKFILKRQYIMDPVLEEEAEFPIAFAIMMFKDPQMAERLLRAIYRPQNFYCIHVDAKSDKHMFSYMSRVASCFDNVIMARQRISVVWGEASVFAQEFTCMEELWIFKRWKYYINLTGQEFPLRTNLELVKILKAFNGANGVGGSINRMKLYMNRLKFVYKGYKRTEERKGPPPINITLAKGPNHIVLVRGSVDFILHDERAQAFRDWLNDTIHPAETFFSSLNMSPQLGMPGTYTGSLEFDPNPRQQVGNNPLICRFKIWSDQLYPCEHYSHSVCIIGLKELQQLRTAPQMFVNKLHSDYHPLAYDCLEEYLFTRVNNELSGHSTFNTSLYESFDFVKHHL